MDRAIESKRVVVTYDDDFLTESSRRLKEDICFYGVIYITEPRNVSTGKLLEDLETVAKVAELTHFGDRKIQYLPY